MRHHRRQHSALLLTSLAALIAAGAVDGQQYQPVLSPVPGDPGATVEIARHPNGQLAKRIFRSNGKAHGLWQEWDSTGRVTYTADWRDDQGEGLWMYFHPNGLVRERSWVTRDVWHGPTEGWHTNGLKAFEGEYVRGAKARPFRYWREDGTPYGPAIELLTPAPSPVPVVTDGWPADFNAWDMSFSRDLEVLFVGTGDSEGNKRRIMTRRWQRDAWQRVELAPFADTMAAEGTPVVTPDGAWVYFSSTRHAATEPDNPRRELYRASRSSGWKTVQRVTFTKAYGEVSLSLARDGRGVMWSGSPDGAAKTGLYEVRLVDDSATGSPQVVIVADLTRLHVGDASGESFPVLSPDGAFLIFSNYAVGGPASQEDMFITRRTPSGWSTPRRLAAGANSPDDDTAVQIVDDGRTLLFSSSRSPGTRLHRVSLDAVLTTDPPSPPSRKRPRD